MSELFDRLKTVMFYIVMSNESFAFQIVVLSMEGGWCKALKVRFDLLLSGRMPKDFKPIALSAS